MGEEIEELKERINRLNDEIGELKEKVASLEAKVDMLIHENTTLKMLLQYVVTPLLIIVGALVGVKIAIP